MNDLKRILEDIRETYGMAVRRHGPHHSGVGWSSRKGQMTRLLALLKTLDDEPLAEVSVADLGCGYGVLWPLLAEREHPQITRYVGLDISQEMLNTARQQYGHDPRVGFQLASLPTEEVDYGFVSGTFNLMKNAAPTEWREYVHYSLAEFSVCCRRGLSFNLLRQRDGRQFRSMYYADPLDWLDFADRLAKDRRGSATLDTSYLVDDFTLHLRFAVEVEDHRARAGLCRRA